MDRHIPDPPPVQNSTRPLKISGKKIEVEGTENCDAIGERWNCGDSCEVLTYSVF